MATQYKGENNNKSLKMKYRLGSIFCGGAAFGVFAHYMMNMGTYVATDTGVKLILIHIAILAVFGGLSKYLAQKANVLSSGLKGEKVVEKMLDTLPDNFVTFNNVPLEDEGRKTELDSLIVCPYGIYIIEVKNHNGDISGSAEDVQWNQHKVGKGGTPYDSKMRNPIKQLNFQIYLLSKILKKRGINNWINGFVLFTNASSVSTNSDKVFTSRQEIMNKISNGGEITMTTSQIKKVEEVVKEILGK